VSYREPACVLVNRHQISIEPATAGSLPSATSCIAGLPTPADAAEQRGRPTRSHTKRRPAQRSSGDCQSQPRACWGWSFDTGSSSKRCSSSGAGKRLPLEEQSGDDFNAMGRRTADRPVRSTQGGQTRPFRRATAAEPANVRERHGRPLRCCPSLRLDFRLLQS
jgi:hypothetical protein